MATQPNSSDESENARSPIARPQWNEPPIDSESENENESDQILRLISIAQQHQDQHTVDALWTQVLSQLHQTNSITHLLGKRILPHIQPYGPTRAPTPSSTDDATVSASAAVTDSTTRGSLHASNSIASRPRHAQSLPTSMTDGLTASRIIQQFRELFKPQMRCNRTTPNQQQSDDHATDLIERWIFQLNDHTTTAPQSITTSFQESTVGQLSTSSLTISPSVQDVLCDLFHPLMVATERTHSVTVTESKLNEPTMMMDRGDGGDVESKIADEDKDHFQLGEQYAQPTRVYVSTFMDMIVELYSSTGLCRRHENLCQLHLGELWTDKMIASKEFETAYFCVHELCSMPHRLWLSWSKNQRPLLEPFIQTHLIPDLANITLEYLLGNEFTIPAQIDRKPQPTYRWRFPLRHWRLNNREREYSPEFEMDGEKWRLLAFLGGNPNYAVPNCLAGYLELRGQLRYYNVVGHFKFRMVHPTDPNKSQWRESTHTWTNYEIDRGFNDLLTPTTIDEWTHASDQCVVMEVAAWKEAHPPTQ